MKRTMLVAILAGAVVAVPAGAKPGNGNSASQSSLGNGNGRGNGTAVAPGRGLYFGDNGCPPGLARKNNGCLPPGQAKKMFERGQVIPRGYGFYTPYGSIPSDYRNRIPSPYVGGNYNYIYRDDYIYVVDPVTRLVADIVSLL